MAQHYYVASYREAWGSILPGLKKLQAMYADPDWSLDGIQEMLDDEDVFLLVDRVDPSAFAIVRFAPYPYSAEDVELFVYLVWHQGGDAIGRFQPHLETFARLGGAKHMRFWSRRRAFLRVAKQHGYSMRSIEYVKEL
jgi:hypothetical protein